MIIFKKDSTNVIQDNVIMLETEEGFIYVSRSVYDQALLIGDRFEGDIARLRVIVSPSGERHVAATMFFWEHAPEPLKNLAPFIGLLDANVEVPTEIETLCGYLHMISKVISFNEFLKVPSEIRTGVKFTKHSISKFRDEWQELESRLTIAEVDIDNIKFEALEAMMKRVMELVPVANVVSTIPANIQVANTAEETVGEPVSEEEEELDNIFSDFSSMFADLSAEETKPEPAREEKVEVKQEPEQPEVVEEVTEASEEDKINSLISRFSGGGY